MPHRTNIEWADYSSNPLRAEIDGKRGWSCAKISPGCLSCYAETINNRFGTQLDYTVANAHKVKHYLDEKELRHILTFRPKGPYKGGKTRPGVFPFDMTDVFAEHIPDELIDRCFAAFALRPDVDFMVLTKRAERMYRYFARHDVGLRWWRLMPVEQRPAIVEQAQQWTAHGLPNIQLGVSAEDQQRADERIPWLLKTPAAVRFVSAEPLLGPVDFSRWLEDAIECEDCGPAPATVTLPLDSDTVQEYCKHCHELDPDASSTICGTDPQLDWVIVGSESGHGRRPMKTEWAASIASDCKAGGVAFFMKQMEVDGKVSGDLGLFPTDLQAREFPQCVARL